VAWSNFIAVSFVPLDPSLDPGITSTTFDGSVCGAATTCTISETPSEPTQIASSEPIDLSSGAYLYDHDDLALGSAAFPIGLTSHRSYSSNNRYTAGPLGLGWSYNFTIRAVPDSDGFKGLGQDSPIDGAAAIVAAYIVTFTVTRRSHWPTSSLQRWSSAG
jgi:hypothetical protein